MVSATPPRPYSWSASARRRNKARNGFRGSRRKSHEAWRQPLANCADKKWCDGNAYTLARYCAGLCAGLSRLSLSRNRMAQQLRQPCRAFREAGKACTIHGNSARQLMTAGITHSILIGDNSATETYVALVNNDRLSRGYGPLRLGKFDLAFMRRSMPVIAHGASGWR